jgi:hypothetical protein
MKKSLRKGIFHLHATYKDGNFSNNLMAEGLTIEVAGNTVILEMDVGRSLRVRSKE